MFSATYPSRLAYPNLPNRRVVVAGAHCERRGPVIHMYMLDLDPAACDDRARDERVVKLLRILVEHVRVALDVRDTHDCVDVLQNRCERREHGARLDELVAIARDEDARVRVQREQGLDECLWRRVSVSECEKPQG